ncbi:L,D-transpeptidase family protein [Vibrio profundum]|uniref:L,D-transpeptidase family protein n=1 Tax=Vibrio profundum TaxID=2910247 RepID=UPI003D138BC1
MAQIQVKIAVLLIWLFPLSSGALERFEKLNWIQPDSSVTSVIQFPDLVDRVYRENDDHLIWYDLEQSQLLEFQLEMIRQAGISPLFSSQLSYLQYYRQANRWFEYDLLATDTLLLYMSYVEQAPLQGESWFFDKKPANTFPPPSEASVKELLVAVHMKQLNGLIHGYTPNSMGYKELSSSYQRLRSYDGKEFKAYEQVGLKKPGAVLVDKAALIQRLRILDIPVSSRSSKGNRYDRNLVKSVRAFQQTHGLIDDGEINATTVKWLNMPIEKRLKMLALNAERARLWPQQRERLIVVNVPSFAMKYWDSGVEVFESKVVVGRKSRRTPVMEVNLDSLVLNPIWNVPWKIMVADILPKVKKDVTYLDQQNIEIIEKWGDKEPVDPNGIDWNSVDPYKFTYKMRQRSGRDNALGLYKFNTPNPRAIFLHDTPSKELFAKETRAFSSGCVRIEKAGQFADLLMDTQAVKRFIKGTDIVNRAIPLKKSIPVHIIYQTVWYESGQVHYRDDIYSYDNFSYGKG